MRDLITLAVRAVVGGSFAAHGAQKAFGAFDGPGPEVAATFMESLGFHPGSTYARLSSYIEMTAGTLVALGAGGPIGPASMIAVMIVAQTTVHAKNGFFAQKGGVELGVLYAAAALLLATNGFGRYALDTTVGLDFVFEDDRLTTAILASGIVGGVLALSNRSPQAPETEA